MTHILQLSKLNIKYIGVKLGISALKYMSCKFNRASHVIFDLDGLLIDTEHVNEQALTSLLQELGHEFTVELKIQVMGITKKDICKELKKTLKLKTPMPKIERIYDSKLNPLLKGCPLMPGAEEIVRHLYNERIPIAIATSSTQEQYDLKTEHLKKYFALFHHIVCGGSDPDVTRGKPNPDIYLTCASRFDETVEPERCLVLEDAPNGATAAIAAGMQCILIPDPITPRHKCKHATSVVKSLSKVRLDYFCLPPLKN